MFRRSLYYTLAIFAWYSSVCGAFAQESASVLENKDAGHFLIELNRATDKSTDSINACELVIFAHNQIGASLDQISFKLAVVDSYSKFISLLSLPLGPMRANDSKFASYTLKLGCGEISKVVVNEIDVCLLDDATDNSGICHDTLEVNSLEAAIEMAL